MPTSGGRFGGSLALLTDLYQLTMAYGYWHQGIMDRDAVFHMSFRDNPFGSGFSIVAGLEQVIDFIEDFSLDEGDLEYLAGLVGADDERLLPDGFLEYLAALRFALDVDAVPEGTAVFPHEPLLRVRGPLLQCQLLETPLLNQVNFQTLIATKASRVVHAAQGDDVIEFGLRRAQGPDGGVTASRAAFVGGCAGTSNVLAGRVHGIPVKGTHAHSWVMAFESELLAFEAYAQAMPNNCVLLVDTYDTLDGVRNAIEIGRSLREAGHDLLGVRLDSGDLAWLSREARRMLDEAGFAGTSIVGSNELDEHLVESLKSQGAAIDVWGVGTKLATADGQPALGGVYKLSALCDQDGEWQYKVKVSEQAAKVTTPGVLQVRRFFDDEGWAGDMIYDVHTPPGDAPTMVDPADPTRRKRFGAEERFEDLLVPVFERGRRVYAPPPLGEVRRRALEQVSSLGPTVARLVNPHRYPVGLEQGLYDTKTGLILRARGLGDEREG
jgi:nicotinate phosphoribosyltransferase